MKVGLFPLGERIQAITPSPFCRVEPHDPEDLECPDFFWLHETPDNEMSEGDYITISQLDADGTRWMADHDLAHRYGGTPTVWSAFGVEQEVFDAVVLYLASLKQRAN